MKTQATPYLFGVLKPLEVNKREATGAAGALVVNYIDPRQGPIAWKHLPQVTLCGVQAQTKHPQTCAGIRVRLEGSTIKVRVHLVLCVQHPFTAFSIKRRLFLIHVKCTGHTNYRGIKFNKRKGKYTASRKQLTHSGPLKRPQYILDWFFD